MSVKILKIVKYCKNLKILLFINQKKPTANKIIMRNTAR